MSTPEAAAALAAGPAVDGSSSSSSSASSSSANTTVFVRHLPYSWGDRELEQCFEHIGPIKRAFVVTTRGSKRAGAQLSEDGAVAQGGAAGVSRGFGFIEFALASDAARAAREMSGKEVGTEEEKKSAKGKGKPIGLAVEISMKKGEKPTVDTKEKKKEEAAAAAAAAAAPVAPKAPKEKKGVSVKDIKLDSATLLAATKTTKEQAKHASDSETSDEESEDEKEVVKKEEKKEVAKTESTATPATKSAAHTPARPSTTTSAPSSSSSSTGGSRIVLLSGINPTVKNLRDHLKGLGDDQVISNLLFPSPESTLKYKAARLTFSDEVLAGQAAKLLDKKLIKGDPVRAIVLHNESKANRLIIRNLPWLVGEKRIHLIFRDCIKSEEQGGGGGTITSIDLPKEADGKSKGFGFISFSSPKAAELALKKTGTLLSNRPIAVDWALSKDDYQNRAKLNEVLEQKQQQKEEKKKKEKEDKKKEEEKKEKKKKAIDVSDEDGEVQVKKEEGAEDEDMLDLGKDKKKNKSILDSILGADEEEEEEEAAKKQAIKEEEDSDDDVSMKSEEEEDSDAAGSDDSDADMDESDEDDDENDDEEEEEDDDSDLSGSDSDSDDASLEADSEEEEEEEDKKRPPRPSDTSQGCTVFIRNLSYDTREKGLLEKFSQFGEVKYAKVVWDKELDRSKGTAFVQFTSPEVAAKVVGMSVDTSTSGAATYKKNRITAAVKSGTGITLDGRVLNITLAVDREKAGELQQANKVKQKEDKRNLYLAAEGHIRPDSDAAKTLSPAELEKRQKAYREKKKKLTNPNYCISRTRLSVRNLPIDADEKVLKRVFIRAARQAVKEVNKDTPLGETLATSGQPTLVQVKLLRATDRLDEKGVGKSKRIGFVEFDVHEHALLTLRKLNNNPEAFAKEEAISKGGRSIRPMVEFALEDARKLHLREMRKQAAEKFKAIKEKQKAELEAAEGKTPVAAAASKKPAAKGPKAKASDSQKPGDDKPAVSKKSGNLPDGGGRGACFTCGQTGHVSKNCPQTKEGGAAATPATGNKRKAGAAGESDTPNKKQKGSNGAAPPASPAPSAAATPASTKKDKKNKNNKHKDSALPKHLRDGEREEQQFDKLVQQHKQKFFGDSTNKESIKQAASRWFDM